MYSTGKLAGIVWLVSGALAVVAQPQPRGPGPGLPAQGMPGPWDRDVIVHRASASGTVTKLGTFERAGVPTIARLKDGRLIAAHQHFPANDAGSFDKVAVRFSADEGKTWSGPHVIQLSGLPEGMRFPFDPTLVPLPDGRVRLYFTGNLGRTFGPSMPAIHSAVSTNGVDYSYEPGARFAVQGRPVIDCAAVLHQGVFHLFAPDNGTQLDPGQPGARPREGVGYHATSEDGLNFTRADDVQITGRRRWLGNAQSDGKAITFFGTGDPATAPGNLPRGSLWMATSADGQSWQLVNSPTVFGGDPGAVRDRDGGLIIVITGEARAGTPSSRQNRPPQRPEGGDRPRAEGGFTRPDGTLDLAQMWSQGRAVGSGPVRFSHSPMRVEDIERIVPYGLMVGGHVCPIDHGYFYPQAGPAHVDVLSPADGFIVVIGHRVQLTGNTERAREYDDYALTIEHSGTFYTQFDLLTQLDPRVLNELDGGVRERFARKAMGPPVLTRIPVKAGQVVGKVGGRSLDFGVVNTEVRLPGFLTPRLYGHYAWRVHVVDPFDYFDEPLKAKLLELNARKVKPFFGRIDYDLDGKLAGNWFLAGTGGYPGNRNDPRGYWMGHLAFAQHHIDPTKVVVSIGDFDGRPRQFWVKGNTPDPAKVGENDGPVKYELVFGALGSSGQAQPGIDTNHVHGVALAQVLPGRQLKFEVFPNRTAGEVRGFTEAARIYER
ncbi:MAG: exo-alpha-sialidase [Verrucomicrobiota bacterium]